MESVSRYESRCPSCNVTFPIETKVCIHCGGRTAPSMVHFPDPPPAPSKGGDAARIAMEMRGRSEAPVQGHVLAEDVDDEPVRVSPLRSLITIVWVALAIGVSLLRACGEGSP